MFRQSLEGVETIYVKVEDESEEDKINEDRISSNDLHDKCLNYGTSRSAKFRLLLDYAAYQKSLEDKKTIQIRLCQNGAENSAESDTEGSYTDGRKTCQNVRNLEKRSRPGRPPKVFDEELDETALRKRNRRRERNKKAAAACRQKRQDALDRLEREKERLTRENCDIRDEIKTLLTARDKLQNILHFHQCELE